MVMIVIVMNVEKIYPYQLPAAFARTQLESLSSLDIDSMPYPYRLTGIVCTIGPASQSVEVLEKMFEAGCSVARMNFSHGSKEYHTQTLENVRAAASRFWLPICIALDTKGPEIRTGILKEACDEKTIFVDYKNIVNVMSVGKSILINDGAISLIVRDKGPFYLKCEVEYGGLLSNSRGVNLPGTDVDLPAVSEKDVKDILFGVDNGVDVIFASFIRSGDAVRSIRQILGDKGKKIKIFSKIENREGVKRFNEILEASDGIMIARGDLGVEIPLEKVFLVQKMITARTLRTGKPIICATQMLESMIENPRPTRAETLDVANAVMDSVDCIMLSAETAKGKWPILCIEIQSKIAKEAECALYHRQLFEELRMLTPKPTDIPRTTAVSAVEASIECMASAIIVLTVSGRSAAMISSYRPRCPIMAVTRDETTSRQLRLFRGVIPIWYKAPKASPFEKDIDNRFQYALKLGEQKGLININNFVVVVHGSKPGSSSTDSVRVIQHARK
ncbi:hypothetical protein HELRODRAFT_156810 [Helobdella robusta]|uniref:Pyruvate kinase n=1 Tax=Helobdella robusta TaxID=6412 RepID=T1EM15_HELRO|nr:hypothetical protein HELRODRAFT_156810 [Helobdella robusta]ESO06980.1 hypothetical protein HELRODRAFT_156810 [Helobdella robusta]